MCSSDLAQARGVNQGVGVTSAWFEANGDLKATNEESDERRAKGVFYFLKALYPR